MNKQILISLIIVLSVLSSCDSKKSNKIKPQVAKHTFSEAEKAKPLKLVDAAYVCMTQNAVYPKKLFPVEHDGKTYYGCCQGCAKSIKKNPEKFCYSTDPVSRKRVDKAKATILNFRGKALYFENEDNARQFSIQQNI